MTIAVYNNSLSVKKIHILADIKKYLPISREKDDKYLPISTNRENTI